MKLLSKSKYLFIGMLLGIAAQLIGLLSHTPLGMNPWGFNALLGDMDVWPLIILLVLHRAKDTPKDMFRDLLLMFIGLNITYYGYTSIIHIANYFEGIYEGFPIEGIIADIIDGASYSFIGLAAAVWGFFMTKLRDKGKKLGYIIMTIPFFIVVIWMLSINIFAIQSFLGMFIVDLICLAIMTYLYVFKSPLKNKKNTKETNSQDIISKEKDVNVKETNTKELLEIV